jgi:hypothetical protein
MLAAAPGIVGSARYHAAAPMPPGEIKIFVIGCLAILAFGAIVMIIWSRFSTRPPKTSPSGRNPLR